MSEPVQNIPLTSDQKVVLMNIQRKILNRQLQIAELEKALQQELQKITVANNIVSAQLDEDLNIIPIK